MKKLLLLLLCIFIVGGVIFFYKENNLIDKKTNESEESTKIEKSLLDEIFDSMSLEEKVGQLFLVRYEEDVAMDLINNYYPGGFILFAKDFDNETKDSIKNKIDEEQSKSKIPLAYAVDEEGGYVTRVSRFTNFRSEKFASPKSYYEQGGFDLLEKMEQEKNELLLSLGINLNLAPVVDIATSEDDFMYLRSFSNDVELVSEFAEKMVGYANASGMSSCLKHFPGYGSNIDTHNGVAIDTRTLAELKEFDLLPFESGINAGVPMIMMSHNIIKEVDIEYPASLSKNVNKILRDDMKFFGIIITDDLAMGATNEFVKNKEAATLAINAGNDLIITSNFIEMHNEVLESIKSGKVSSDDVDNAVRRILKWKIDYNIIAQQ